MNADQTQVEPTEIEEKSISEKRLWSAVLLQAIEDWRSGNLRRRTEARRFFFGDQKDFITVCRSAGFEPSYVSRKLGAVS